MAPRCVRRRMRWRRRMSAVVVVAHRPLGSGKARRRPGADLATTASHRDSISPPPPPAGCPSQLASRRKPIGRAARMCAGELTRDLDRRSSRLVGHFRASSGRRKWRRRRPKRADVGNLFSGSKRALELRAPATSGRVGDIFHGAGSGAGSGNGAAAAANRSGARGGESIGGFKNNPPPTGSLSQPAGQAA